MLHINNIVGLVGGGAVSTLDADDVKLFCTVDSEADRSRLQSSLTSLVE